MKRETIDIKIVELLLLTGNEFLTIAINHRCNEQFYYIYNPQTSDYETLTPVVDGIEIALDKAIHLLSIVEI